MESFKRFIQMLYNSYDCELPDTKNHADLVNCAAQDPNKVMLGFISRISVVIDKIVIE
jgi:hypothetical protein